MRFTWHGQQFEGPPVDEGLLGGFTLGELKWLRRELKIPGIQALDVVEGRVAYCVLTIRREDHTLLPLSMWDDLTFRDFPLVPHPIKPGRDGDCTECQMTADAPVHIEQDIGPDPTRPGGEDEEDQPPTATPSA